MNKRVEFVNIHRAPPEGQFGGLLMLYRQTHLWECHYGLTEFILPHKSASARGLCQSRYAIDKFPMMEANRLLRRKHFDVVVDDKYWS